MLRICCKPYAMLPNAWSSFGMSSKLRVEVVVEFVCFSKMFGRVCVLKFSVWSSLRLPLFSLRSSLRRWCRVCGRVCVVGVEFAVEFVSLVSSLRSIYVTRSSLRSSLCIALSSLRSSLCSIRSSLWSSLRRPLFSLRSSLRR